MEEVNDFQAIVGEAIAKETDGKQRLHAAAGAAAYHQPDAGHALQVPVHDVRHTVFSTRRTDHGDGQEEEWQDLLQLYLHDAVLSP